MKIEWDKGRKCKGDRIIKTTTDHEPISLFRIALLLNQFGINEAIIKREKNYSNYFFGPAMKEVLDYAERGIDWAKDDAIITAHIKQWCKCHKVKYELIEQELNRVRQMKLGEFK